MDNALKDGYQRYEIDDGKGYKMTAIQIDDKVLAYATNMEDVELEMVHRLYTSRFG